jgi:hypothetical protein
MATDETPCNHLDRLSTELKCAVARLTFALKDRKSLVLVNKTWADVILPFLWEVFITDLTNPGQRNLLGLAHPGSNILKHVRNIHLLKSSLQTNVDHLPTLLAAIPRGQLQGFKSDGSIPLSTVNLLLLLHPKLENLCIPGSAVLSSALNSAWTTGCFSRLTHVAIQVGNFSREGFRKLWVECPNLRRLELRPSATTGRFFSGVTIADQSNIDEDFFVPAETSTQLSTTQHDSVDVDAQQLNVVKLENLFIGNVVLPKTLNTMFQRIDALALNEFTLDTFSGATDLFEALEAQFKRSGPCLKRLRIVRLPEQVTEEFTTSLYLLLMSFCGLHQFHLQCTNCHKVEVNGILNHGESLKDLMVVNGGIHREDKTRCLDASDLQKIATACTELEQLCINLYEVDVDRNESDVLHPQQGAPDEIGFEQALAAIAQMPNLEVLCLTNPPNYRKAFHRPGDLMRFFHRSLQGGEQRYAFHARADGLMQFLGECGSKIKVLAFSPMERLVKPGSPDKHGFIWPNYFYYREEMTDHKGSHVSVARPLADWKREFPGATILEDI